jgi:hypothetical protein
MQTVALLGAFFVETPEEEQLRLATSDLQTCYGTVKRHRKQLQSGTLSADQHRRLVHDHEKLLARARELQERVRSAFEKVHAHHLATWPHWLVEHENDTAARIRKAE